MNLITYIIRTKRLERQQKKYNKLKQAEEEIRNLSPNQVLKRYADGHIETNIYDICKNLSVDVQEKDMSELEQQYNKIISGILWNDSDGTVIYLNRDDTKMQQNLTLAHTLSYCFLSDCVDQEIIFNFKDYRCDFDKKAYTFARKLLMPEDAVIKAHKQCLIPTRSYFAKKFNVSESMMHYRLRELELDFIEV